MPDRGFARMNPDADVVNTEESSFASAKSPPASLREALRAGAPSAVQLLVVLALIAAAYVPGLFHAFVYDDHGTILENSFLEKPGHVVRVLTLQTLSDPRVIDGQRPTLLLASFLDRAVWGAHPFGWHLTSLLLHLACVALFYRLVSSLLPASRVSLLLALLFGLHPVLSETVQMPSYREDLLVAAFGLAYLLDCARGRLGRSLAWFSLALLSKESAVVAPALAASLWFLFPKLRPARRAQLLHLGTACLLIALYAWTVFLHRPAQAMSAPWNGLSLPWPDNLVRAPGLFLFYLRLLLVPWPLCADRAVPSLPWGAGLCALAGVLFLAWRLRRRRPLAAFGLLWLFLGFLPVANLLPLLNPVAERYLYSIAPGLLLVFAGFAGPRWTLPLLAAAALGFAGITVRLRDWRSNETLWTSVLRVNPSSARAHTWLGLVAKQRGTRAEAARLFARAEELNPHDISALVNLAVLDGEAGDLSGAERRLREALRRRPDHVAAWQNLAQALRLQGRASEADQAASEAAARTSP